MSQTATTLTGAAPVFVVRDLAAALPYYRDILGFTVTFAFGTPEYYACLCRDDVALHLIATTATQRAIGQSSLCIFTTNADAIHAELTARGARISVPIADRAYGMRDFNVVDSDGNELVFGTGAKASK